MNDYIANKVYFYYADEKTRKYWSYGVKVTAIKMVREAGLEPTPFPARDFKSFDLD